MEAWRENDLESVLLSSAFSLFKHLRDSSKTWKLLHIIVIAATPEQVLFPTEVGETISPGFHYVAPISVVLMKKVFQAICP